MLPHFAVCLSLNILVTIMIATQLLSMKWKVARALGKQHAKEYIPVLAIIIESTALFALASIVFLVLTGLNHPAQQIILPMLPQIEVRLTFLQYWNGILTYH